MVDQMARQLSTQAPLSDSEEYAKLLSFQDLVIRAVRNTKFSDVYIRLYLSLVDTYPQLLNGQQTEVEVWQVRKNAGEKSEQSATRFFQDLSTIGALEYQSIYDKKTGARRSCVTPLPDFDAVETFDTRATERKRKAQEAEAKRRNQFKDPRKLMQCPECGSENLFFDVVAHCHCGYVAEPIRDIPSRDIIIEAEVIEITDDFVTLLDRDATSKRPAIAPARPLQISLPETPTPAAPAIQFGKHPRGIACPDCHGSNNWYPVARTYSDEPLWNCGICMPPE